MNLIRALALVSLITPCLQAQTPAATATTGKPNVFGEQKTQVRDTNGRLTGTATATKPNVFGETRTTFRDPTGRVTGTGTTVKPNVFGETKTTFRDANGRSAGMLKK